MDKTYDLEEVPHVATVIEGGVVQRILSNAPIKSGVIDYDTSGADENEELVPVLQEGGTSALAYAYESGPYVLPEETAEAFKAVRAAKNPVPLSESPGYTGTDWENFLSRRSKGDDEDE